MASVKFELDAEEAKAVQGFLRVVDSQRRAERQFRRTNRRVRQQNRLVSTLASRFGVAATSFAAAAGSVRLVTAAFEEFNRVKERAAQEVERTEFPVAQLAQLAGGDPDKFLDLIGDARKTQSQAGIGLDEAARLQFSLESFGVGEFRKLFAGFAGITDPSALAEGAATLQAAFGQEETGAIPGIVNKLLSGSAVSKTTIEQFAPAATVAAQSFRQIGATDEELLGFIAILSRATKSADVAATQLSALADVIDKKGITSIVREKGFFAGLDRLQDLTKGLSGDKLIEFFGRKEGRKGFQAALLNRDAIAQTIKEIREAEGGNLALETQRMFHASPRVQTARLARIAEQSRIDAEEGLAVEELKEQAALDTVQAFLARTGAGAFERFSRTTAAEIRKFFGGDVNEILTAGTTGLNPLRMIDLSLAHPGGEIEEMQREYLRIQNQNTGELRTLNAILEKRLTERIENAQVE